MTSRTTLLVSIQTNKHLLSQGWANYGPHPALRCFLTGQRWLMRLVHQTACEWTQFLCCLSVFYQLVVTIFIQFYVLLYLLIPDSSQISVLLNMYHLTVKWNYGWIYASWTSSRQTTFNNHMWPSHTQSLTSSVLITVSISICRSSDDPLITNAVQPLLIMSRQNW